MNPDLIENTVKCHGTRLMKLIMRYNGCDDVNDDTNNKECDLIDQQYCSSSSNSNNNGNQQIEPELEPGFNDKLLNFIAKKSEFLFNDKFFGYNVESNKDDVIEVDDDEYQQDEEKLPPLETFMDVSSRHRKEHLLKYLEPDDVVVGKVTLVTERGIHMNMLCFASDEKVRDLTHVKLHLLCPLQNAIKYSNLKENSSLLSQLQSCYLENDLVRCVIVDVDQHHEMCHVSIQHGHKQRLGIISSDQLPSHYYIIQDFNEEPYLYSQQVKRQKTFYNLAGVSILKQKLKLKPTPQFSLMKGLFNIQINPEEMASSLYKEQNRKLALLSVYKGVSLIKDNRSSDAMLCFNKALSIDQDNVEAYVARGAIFANDGNFDRAIRDFDQALELDPAHANATKYLKEVYLAKAVKLEKNERLEDAVVLMRKALEKEPGNELIKTRLDELTRKLNEDYYKSMYGPRPIEVAASNNNSNYSSSSSHHKKKKKKKKHHHHKKRSRSRSASSSSSSSDDSVKVISNKKEVTVIKNKQLPPPPKETTKADDEEDLEDFFNKLKQQKANNKSSLKR